MAITFENLKIGGLYDRTQLSKLWGYNGNEGLQKGVVTPSNSKFIILFVTKEKDKYEKQYTDFIDGRNLHFEGQEKHGTDNRIVDSIKNKDDIFLFFRDQPRTPFVYYGKVSLTDYRILSNKPSEFIFAIESFFHHNRDILDELHNEEWNIDEVAETERLALEKSRVGQGVFREKLFQLWSYCSVTSLSNPSLLRASHIKPWRESTNRERLDPFNGLLLIPSLDALFDQGYITFDRKGGILISDLISNREQSLFNVNDKQKLRYIYPDNNKYLDYHREKIFRS